MGAVDPRYLKRLMLDRGIPDHVADAFLINFRDESGFDPGINEVAPLVPGSRGGFGLYQLTGPRRVAYEKFASERGVPLDDPAAQIDFMMFELEGPESRAAESIFAAPDAQSAAVAVARDFLRPSEENLAKRVARYGGQEFSYGSGQTFTADAPGQEAAEKEGPSRLDNMMTAFEMISGGDADTCPPGTLYDAASQSCVPVENYSMRRPQQQSSPLERFGLSSLV